MEPENPALDDYILGLTGQARPKVAFVPTASGDADAYLLRFYQAFADGRCRASHLALSQRTIDDLRAYVLGQDMIYVGGGNTANLLAVWRAHGLDVILHEAWTAGVVLCGVSAGALCWFQGGVTDSFGSQLAVLRDGLGLLAGSHCPHYDGEPGRRPAYHRCIEAGLPAGIAADDGCGLHFEGTALAEVIASRPQARAYKVERTAGGIVETALPARLLR